MGDGGALRGLFDWAAALAAGSSAPGSTDGVAPARGGLWVIKSLEAAVDILAEKSRGRCKASGRGVDLAFETREHVRARCSRASGVDQPVGRGLYSFGCFLRLRAREMGRPGKQRGCAAQCGFATTRLPTVSSSRTGLRAYRTYRSSCADLWRLAGSW